MNTNIYHITYTPDQREVCVHFWGCNFSCRGCYCLSQIFSPMLNFDSIIHNGLKVKADPPTKYLILGEVKAILDRLDFNKVVIEGQEAGLDPAYRAFTQMVHDRYSSKITLVTNACELPDLSFTDILEVGIKALDDPLHIDYTGMSNKPTLHNLDRLISMGKRVVVDTVIIPGYIDTAEVERIALHIAARDKNIPYILLPYFPIGDNPWRRPTPQEMEAAAAIAKKYLNNVYFFRGNEELQYKVVSIFPEQVSNRVNSPSTQFTVSDSVGETREVVMV